jgi:hypothetical protein
LLQKLNARSVAVGGRLRRWFDGRRDELAAVFRDRGLNDVAVITDTEMPPSSKAHWFRWQINEAAHKAGHYADFRVFTGWSSLRVRLDKWQLRYVASLHGAGRDPGVMAVTTFAEIEPFPLPDAEEESPPARDYVPTTNDAFRFVHSETIEQVNQRAPELDSLLDEGLEVALSALLRKA